MEMSQLGCVVWQFSSVQCYFTSTETVRTVRDGAPWDGHLDFHTAPEQLCGLTHAAHVDDVELHVLGCQVDILGTNCDQCVCMVRCCFTSTETMRLLDCVAHVLVVKNWTTLQAASLSGTFLFGRRDVINQCLEFGIWPVHPHEKFAFINNLKSWNGMCGRAGKCYNHERVVSFLCLAAIPTPCLNWGVHHFDCFWFGLTCLLPSCLRRGTGRDRDPRRVGWGRRGTIYPTLHSDNQNDTSALRWATMRAI